MTLGQAAFIVALAILVFGRSSTRTWRGFAMVCIITILILVVGLSGLPSWRAWVQAALFAAASGIAIVYPWLLRTERPFSVEFAEVDARVWDELMVAEKKWRDGIIDDTAYSAAFDRANVRYRALQPPNAEWREILSERIRIREEWSRVFGFRAEPSDEQRDRLAHDERRLRRRIARLSR